MNAIELFAKFVVDTSALDSAVGAVSGIGKTVGNGLATAAKIGAEAIAATSTAVTAIGAASVSAGMDFDKSMSQVAATMGLTTEEMQSQVGSVDLAWGSFSGNLREYAQEMGKNTAFSATEAADALNYMALAGYDAQTSMEMLPNVLNLAAAGGMDLGRASDMVTDTQTALGISLERTSQMVDEMAKASSTGNTSVEQLGDAFLTVGGLAQELNGGMVTLADGTEKPVDGIQELEIALTAMANAGVKGSEAGTHMRNMLMKLSSPTSDGAKQLEALGVSVFDAEGNMRSLSDIFGELSGAMDDLSQEEKIQAVSDLFNARDLASAEALLGAVEQDWDTIGASILDAEGAAQQMADTQLDNLAGDITLFQSALEGAKIAISDELTPGLRDFVQFGTDGLSRLTSAFNEGGLEGAVNVFGDLLSEGLTMIVQRLPDVIAAGTQLLGALMQGLLDNSDVILGAISQIVTQILESLTEALDSDGGEQILAFIWGLLQIFNDNIDTILQIGFTILEGIVNGLVESIPIIIDSIVILLEAIIEAITDNFEILVEGALQIILALADGISKHLPTLIPQIVNLIIYIAQVLTQPDNLLLIIQAAVQIIGALISGIVQAIPNLVRAIPTVILNLVEALLLAVPQVLEVGGQLIEGLIEGIFGGLAGLLAGIADVVKSIIDSFKDLLGIHSPSTVFEDLGGNLMQGLIDGISGMASAVWDTVSGIAGSIKDTVGGIVDSAKSWGSDMMSNLSSGISSAYNSVSNAAKGAADKVADFLHFSEPDEGPLSDFHTYAPDMMALFAKGVTDNEDLVADAIDSAFDFGNFAVSPTLSGAVTDQQLSNWNMMNNNNPQSMTVVLEMDKAQFAKAVFELNRDEVQRMGMRLANV